MNSGYLPNKPCQLLSEKQSIWVFRLLQCAAVCVLAGRAYQHFFWDAPYRAILWDESLMRPWLEWGFGISWKEYAGDLRVDRAIQAGMKVIGSIFGLSALVAAFPRVFPPRAWKILIVSSGLLLILALLYYKEQNYQFGMFIEYALQVCTPFFFYKRLVKGDVNISRERFIRWATALTFAGHGLYAVGFYPRPGHFTVMVINALHIPVDWANQVLWAAGILDFLAAFWLLIPVPGRRIFIWYCIIWGFATSIARIWANFYPQFWLSALHQWLFEFVYRSPHFLIPMALLFLNGGEQYRKRRRRKQRVKD